LKKKEKCVLLTIKWFAVWRIEEDTKCIVKPLIAIISSTAHTSTAFARNYENSANYLIVVIEVIKLILSE